MLRFDESASVPHGLSRRDWLRAGSLGFAGLGLADLVRESAQAAPESALDRTFGRAKNLLFLFLAGGPSQYEILYLLGLDHERLTYRHAGRDFRLTDVHGRVVNDILA